MTSGNSTTPASSDDPPHVTRIHWPPFEMLISCVGTLTWLAVARSPAVLAIFVLTLTLTLLSIGYARALNRSNAALAACFNWATSFLGAIGFVVLSPEFLPISILCLLEGAISIPSLDDADHRLPQYSAAAIACLVLILLIKDAAARGHPLFDVHLNHVELILASTLGMVSYGIVILRNAHKFFTTVHSNLTKLRNTNDELGRTDRELMQHLQERMHLLEVSRAINSTQDYTTLIQNILVNLKNIIDYRRTVLMLLRDGVLQPVGAHGPLPEPGNSVEELLNRPGILQQRILPLREPLIVNPKTEVSSIDGSWMGVPLIVRGNLIGILSLYHPQIDYYDQHDADLCMTFANQVAGLIDAAQLQAAAADAMVVAERHRLARDLHDAVSQSLFGIFLGMRTALEQLDKETEATRDALAYSISLADKAFGEMRALILTLRPETLEQQGLIAALQGQIDLLQPHHDIRIQLDVPDGEPDVPIGVKENFYRITTEAMQNAIRHSACRSLHIRIDAHPTLRAEIIDDGRGFDPRADYGEHLGLKTMRERAAALGGVLHIESIPGKGTRITAHITKQPGATASKEQAAEDAADASFRALLGI